jgi:signal transduction histidine kinase/ActR/RegA family two-component response regulator
MRWSDEQFGLLGLTPGSAEPTYELWKQCLHSEDRDSPSLADLCRRTITDLPDEYRIVRPDGQVRWLSSRGQTLLDEDGKPARIVGITIDVTQSKETQQQLQDLNEALLQRTEEAEQRTNQLRAVAAQLTQTENRERRRLAMLLHDHLQQLLIASRMKLGALKQQLKTPELGKMLRQTAQLIDEAIQASRSLSVELSPPMLYDAGLAPSLEWLAQQMEEKHGLAVEVEATDEPEDEDIRIFLFQCVRELLFNIVKHAQAGRATVLMERLNSDHIVIRVRDEGRGFDISQLEAGWSKGESFGLLSIRERLQLLGGRLEIQSTPGQGTTMQLIAPVRKPRTKPSEVEKLLTPAARANPPAAAPATEALIRILVADDHPIVRQGLTSLLEHEPDFKIVAQAGDAESAIETACNVAVDVVLMDFSMPRINGAEATRRIHEAKPDLPVIGMSVYQEQSVADSMRQAGAVAFFRKDESSEHLVTVIRAYGRHTKGR